MKGRKHGPGFVTERRARVPLHAADLDEHGRARLSYQQAEALFREDSGGATLHQALRHSGSAHNAEDGTGTPDADGPLRSHLGPGRWPST